MSELRVRRFGEGPLSRASAMIYTLLVVEIALLVTTLPGLLPLLLLERDASNLPLVAGCALPIGPALSGALYALHHRHLDLTDLAPAKAFWHGYKINFFGVLKIWALLLAWLTIVAVNLSHLAAAGIPGWWAVLLVVIAAGAALWGVNTLVIASLFSFRTRDIARLALYFLGRAKGVTLGNVCLLVVAAGITALTSEVVVVLLGSVLALLLLRSSHPMITEIQKEFTE
ncbi:hypothetical protein Rhe02_40170 [Rhizocola hellebori]|uniref:DUF624 domain-containing protein n=1 Tax=Rhizocola hellebori TaxID=1392758 RepID=A0A8J3VGY4_9ACTN|nr:DUF624 domain-containing protein [Rhizocola hellebori]GIH05950.1 hypothetical protein Rhe02_40170 [Rhizocola hellebori]